MAFWTPFFPFGLKWKPLLGRHVMISLKTFAPKTKAMGSSFIKSIYIFNIFHHLRAGNESKSKVKRVNKNKAPFSPRDLYFILQNLGLLISRKKYSCPKFCKMKSPKFCIFFFKSWAAPTDVKLCETIWNGKNPGPSGVNDEI